MKKKEIVESSTSPTNKNVLWVDTSENTPTLKSHINGSWNSIGGEKEETKLMEGCWGITSDFERHVMVFVDLNNEGNIEMFEYPLDSMSFYAEDDQATIYSGSTKLGVFNYGDSGTNTLSFAIDDKEYYAENSDEFINFWEHLTVKSEHKTYNMYRDFDEGSFSSASGISPGDIIKFNNFSFLWIADADTSNKMELYYQGSKYVVSFTSLDWDCNIINVKQVITNFSINKTPVQINTDGWTLDCCSLGTILHTSNEAIELTFDAKDYSSISIGFNNYIGFAKDYYVRVNSGDRKVKFCSNDYILVNFKNYNPSSETIVSKSVYPINCFNIPQFIKYSKNYSPIAQLVESNYNYYSISAVYKDTENNFMVVVISKFPTSDNNIIYKGILTNTSADWTVSDLSGLYWEEFLNTDVNFFPFEGLILKDKNNEEVTLKLESKSTTNITYNLMYNNIALSSKLSITLDSDMGIDEIKFT